MTYMPELKDELVRAAGAPRTATRRPPRRFLRQATPGRLAPALGALIAVAVAIAALVVAHPGTKEPVPGGSSGSARTARLASLTASKTLTGFSLPPGAVPTRTDPSRPRQLGTPAQELPRLALPHVIHLHRFWRLTAGPQQVLNWIFSHEPTNGGSAVSSEGSTSGSSTSSVISFDGELDVPTSRRIEAIVGYHGVPLPHGGTALRVDVEVGWPAPALISSAVDRIVVAQVAVVKSRLKAGRTNTLRASRARRVVALLNSLPTPDARRAVACIRSFRFPLELVFFRRGHSKPIGVGFVSVRCSGVWLTLTRTPTTGAERWLSPSGTQLRRLLTLTGIPIEVGKPR
jgi:hypothetical protein